MVKKLTNDCINTKLQLKGMYLASDYINSTTSVKIKCSFGHEWITRVANIINRGDNCPYCSMHSSKIQHTRDSLNSIFKSKNVYIKEEFIGTIPVKKKVLFQCDHGHEWKTTINSMLSKTTKGCKECYGKNIPLTLEQLQERYKHLGYSLSGPFVNTMTKLEFTCDNGHIWWAYPLNTRCSSCASYGFNNTKEAYGYILVFETFIKYGISNSIESRLYRHKLRNPKHNVYTIHKFSDGIKARKWEREIKNKFGEKFANKFQCPDGWTETTSLDNLADIIKTLSY